MLCVDAPVAYLSSRPVPVLQNAVTLDNYNATDYLNCTVKGYPTSITIMKNNVILASMNQNNNTVMLKLSVAKSESGMYCCKASNALGSNKTCLAVFVRGSKFQWKAISVGTGFLVLLILSTIAHVQIRKRSVCIIICACLCSSFIYLFIKGVAVVDLHQLKIQKQISCFQCQVNYLHLQRFK